MFKLFIDFNHIIFKLSQFALKILGIFMDMLEMHLKIPALWKQIN